MDLCLLQKKKERKMSESNIEANPTTIYPALDFSPQHAYIGQKMHSRNFPGRSKILYIITDKRSIMEFREITSEIRNIRLQYIDFNMEQRWSWEGIDSFVNGSELVEPLQLLTRIKELFKAYIELCDKRLYDFLTLWSIGTYFYWLFNTYPYVYVGGISGSGKTKLLTLCSYMCFNSVSSADVSLASLFRLIQSTRCSVFIDESEALSNWYGRSDLRSLLLSGYKKGQKVYRCRRTNEGNFETESFEVYSPKMLVNIEGLEAVLGSRCIISSCKGAPTEKSQPEKLSLTILSGNRLET
jgi:DNA-binding PadR family transcriptional regulator